MRKVFLTESQARKLKDADIPMFVTNDLDNGDGVILGGDRDFSLLLISRGISSAREAFKDDLSKIPTDELSERLSKLIRICVEREKPIRKQLEGIVSEYISSTFACCLPDDVHLELVEQIDPSHEFHVYAGTDEEREYDSVEQAEAEGRDIEKREIVDALIQGASMAVSEKAMRKMVSEIFELDEELPHLYSKVIKLNTYLIYAEDVKIKDEDHKQGGYTNVTKKPDGEVTLEVKAQIFPILLSEAIKGVLEAVSISSLPEDVEQAKSVINAADALENEPWYMRYGMPLWNRYTSHEEIDEEDVAPLIETIVKAGTDSFMLLFKEVAMNTRKAKDIISKIAEVVRYNSGYKDFQARMQDKEKNLITDEEII